MEIAEWEGDKENKSKGERQVPNYLIYMWNINKNNEIPSVK